MKYAIIADIHANLEALQTVLEDSKGQKCTHHVSQADVMGALLTFAVFQNRLQRLQIGVDVSDDCVFHVKSTSAHYFKPAKSTHRFAPAHLFVANEAANFAVLDGPPERFELLSRSFNRQLDPAISQIANRSGDFKSRRQRFDRVAKPD